MNKFITLLMLVALHNISFSQAQVNKFYYAYDKKIYLTQHKTKAIIKYSLGDTTNNNQTFKILNPRVSRIRDKVVTCNFVSNTDMQTALNDLKLDTNIVSMNPVYQNENNLELGVTDEIIVSFESLTPKFQLEKIISKYKLKIIKSNSFYYLLQTPKKSDALEIANEIQESGLVVYSHPNFIAKADLLDHIPNDPYFNMQWTLHNTGQTINDGHVGTPGADVHAVQAWDITKGSSNITIAVIDQGVTSNHPDLPNTRQIRLNGSNFASSVDGTNANDPSPVGDGNHGNACAGTIAATMDNNEGITGIAPNCKIMPVRIPVGLNGGTPEEIASAINFAWQNGADILSNSWGYNSTDPNAFPVIVQAISQATTNGRGGLGSVVLFAAGNTASHNSGNNGFVEFPANVNISGVLTVGASDRNDQQAIYSPTSNPLSPQNQIVDLVAPSHKAYSCQISTETFEVWAIDIPSTSGYNSNKETDCGSLPIIGEILPSTGTNYLSYTGRFGGTSHACPLTAGIAALVLSVNAYLTQQQVYNILTNTTDKVGGYTYTNGISNELGYGRVNAYQALTQMTCNYTTIQNTNYNSNTLINACAKLNLTNVTINNNASVTINANNYGITINAPFQATIGSSLQINK